MYSPNYSMAMPRAYSSPGFHSRTSSEIVSYTPISSLEAVVHHTASVPIRVYQSSKAVEVTEPTQTTYTSVSNSANSSSTSFTYHTKVAQYFAPERQREYHTVDSFLRPYRPATQFIAEAAAVESFVKEAFAKTICEELPSNIIIRVFGKEDMRAMHEAHSGNWSDTIQGFSLNTKPYKQIFVKQAPLDQIMVVMGHEIGHVLTDSLGNIHDEEAKAFAFELAWVQTILKHNIANLKDNLTLDLAPAKNGLHDVAKAFVAGIVASGKEALEAYRELGKRILSIAS
ncbi:hypothetical protein HZA99_02720 [Candidatus Woesearchaeota archaeon]|nr:hypothetical protein [Candidatus Woesearchaeota archaeon]